MVVLWLYSGKWQNSRLNYKCEYYDDIVGIVKPLVVGIMISLYVYNTSFCESVRSFILIFVVIPTSLGLFVNSRIYLPCRNRMAKVEQRTHHDRAVRQGDAGCQQCRQHLEGANQLTSPGHVVSSSPHQTVAISNSLRSLFPARLS